MPKMKHKTVWCNKGWTPHHIAFCPTEKGFRRELARLNVDKAAADAIPYHTAAPASTHTFVRAGGSRLSIVTLGPEVDAIPPLKVIGLIAHEASHVLDHALESMGDDHPSAEFKAYALQAITQGLLAAYEKTRRKLTR